MAGNIKGITIEFQADATKLTKELRNIEKETATIDRSLSKLKTGLKFNPTSVSHWKKEQQLLTEKVSDTRRKLQILKDEQKAMTDAGVKKNSEEYQRLQREIVETNSKLKTFKRQLIEVGNARLKALSEGFKKVGRAMTSAGKTLTTNVTMPLAILGTVAAKNFAETDKVMQLTNSTMKNTEEEAKLLSQAMKDAASNSTYGMNDAAQASLNFARAGLTAKQAADAMAPAMNLAAGEGGNLDTVSGGLVATINGFHGAFSEAARYADVFANACNNSALDVDSLSNAMSVAAPIFSAAGYSVEDAALYMGVMANNGIEANKAANSLKTGLARLISPAKDGAEMMDKLGINVTNADGSMKDSITIQKELNKAFSKLSESEQIAAASAIFGKNQMAPWLALINTAPKDVNSLSEALEAEGTAGQMASDMMSGFGGSLEKLKSSIDVAANSLGEALAPVISKVVEWIQKAVDWFNSLDDRTKTIIATVGVVVAALGPVLVILGSLFTAIGTIIGAISSLGTALTMLSGPVGIVIAIIGGLIAAGIAIYKNWDTIKAKAVEFKKKVVAEWKAFKDGVVQFAQAMKEGVVNAWNALKSKVTEIFGNLKSAVTNAWNSIKSAVLRVAAEVTLWTLKRFIAVRDGVKNAFTSIKNTAVTIWNGIKTAITKPIAKAWEFVKGIVDKIKSLFSGLNISLPHIKLPHFSIQPAGWKIGDLLQGQLPKLGIEWYKQGAIFTKPTVAGLGEAGPEGIIPLDKLWSKMDAIASASGGDTFVFNISGSASDAKAIADQIATEVEKILVSKVQRRTKAWA